MVVNPGGDGGDMSPPIRGLLPQKKQFKRITLYCEKYMYTYNNLSRKNPRKKCF